jgi:RND family efflux transporter MFP subunit
MAAMSRATWIPVLLLVSVPLLGCKQGQSQAPPPEPLKVDVSTPINEPISNYEVFTGRTQAYNYADVRARVTGYLWEARFKEGEDVKEGAVLFVVDPRPYDATLNQANANLELQKAQLKYNEADYNRQVDLRNKQAVSQDEVEKSGAARDTAQASVRSAEAAVRTAKLNRDFTEVLAPADSTIKRRQVDPGSLIQADNTIMASLVEMDKLYAYFDVDERTLLRFRHLLPEGKVPPEAAARLPVTLGFANEKPEEFSHAGELKFADNKVDPSTGTLRMWGIFQNPQRDLFSGLFVRVRMQIPMDAAETAKWKFVSEAALQSDQGQQYLYVVKQETRDDGQTHNVVVRVNVERGQRKDHVQGKEGTLIAVKGLKGDERVVVSNWQRVRPKTEVEPKEVDMPRSTTATSTTSVAGMPGSGAKDQASK